MIEFPAMKILKREGSFEGIGALELQSIFKGNLLNDRYPIQSEEKNEGTLKINPKSLQVVREAFLNSLSFWPSSVTLEMRITSIPNISFKAQGKFCISLVLRVSAKTEESAKEEFIRRYLDLRPLLAAYCPEAEFAPVRSLEFLEDNIFPFDAKFALTVQRKRESLVLSAPLKKTSTGFRRSDEIAQDEEGIVHTSYWIPSLDDWSNLLEFLAGLLDPLTIIVRIRSGGEIDCETARLMGMVQTCESYLARLHEHRLTIEKQVAPIRDLALRRIASLRNGCFRLGVFLLSPTPINPFTANVVGTSITGMRFPGEDNPFEGKCAVTTADPKYVQNADYYVEEELFTTSEAASAFRLPSPPHREIPGLPVKRSRTSLAVLPHYETETKDAIKLFMNEYQGMRTPVYLTVRDSMRHVFIAGATGCGKSTLIENMCLQHIHAGRGVALIDPHGDSAERILASIPPERAEDVLYWDLLDRDMPIGFNIFQWSTIEERDLLIDELYMTLDRIYDFKETGGPIFEAHFRGFCKLAMGDGSEKRNGYTATLLDIVRCYTDKEFRKWLGKTIDDPQLADFLAEIERVTGEGSIDNISIYVTSKFNRFVNDMSLRRIIGQPVTSFNFDEIINGGKIFLVKLGKGRFGSVVSALLTNMIVSRFKLAAMKRGEMPEEDRRPFFLFVDEAHNLPAENFTEMLAESRKYRLSLVLATQYCAQLRNRTTFGGDDLLAAIYGNVGTIILYRMGAEDAKSMESLLFPFFNDLDIIGLPNFHGYTRISMESDAVPPFSFRAERNTFPKDTRLAESIKSRSREKYGVDKDKIDMEIRKGKRWYIHNNGDGEEEEE